MTPELPRWVVDAASLPVAFAQVREDALNDLRVVEQLGAGVRIIMVASGGCTAALLAACDGVASVHMVDPNPAQLALTRLKLRLLQRTGSSERLELLGHAELAMAARRARLAAELDTLALPAEILGPVDFVAELGPDHAGRYERLFAQLREALRDHEGEVQSLLMLDDRAEQARRVAPEAPLGRALDDAFDSVMSLPHLVHIFGADATHNPMECFPSHFVRRTRYVLATQPAAGNPYLWQVLAGRFPPQTVSPWLAAPVPARMAPVSWEQGFMLQALQAAMREYDLVHLSNILDWLTPDAAGITLEAAWSALRPGGCVLIRQLNSTLDIPSLNTQFEWRGAEAAALHAADRSFFYRALHLGRKR